jgi:next-to-BRCA1 protein 1
MAIVVKIKFNDDTRRITLERNPSFDELVAIVKQLFGTTGDFVLKYEDDEKDFVTVTSDMELREALTIAARSNNVLRLFVSEKSKSQKPASDGKGKAPEPQPQQPFFNPDAFAPFIQMLNPETIQRFLSQLLGDVNANVNVDVNDIINQLQNMGLGQQDPQQQGQQHCQQLHQLLQQFLTGNPWLKELLLGLRERCCQNPSACGPCGPCPSPCTPPAGSSNTANNNNAPEGPAVHEGVTCDGCNTGIVGVRYKCTVCHNYDLCEKCEVKGAEIHDPSHPLLKISVPFRYRQHGHGHGPQHHFGRGFWFGGPRGMGGRGCPYARKWAKCGTGDGSCNSNRLLARFVKDVSIEDGTCMLPSSKFVKIWKMRNEGNGAWPEGTVLSHVGGDQLGAREAVAVTPVAAGEEVDIAIDMVAPGLPGRYISYWRLTAPDGTHFGQRVWVDVLVEQPQEHHQEQPTQNLSHSNNVQIQPMQTDSQPQPQPQPEPQPAVAQAQAQVNDPSITREEEAALKVLAEMGFAGDLLAPLRRNRGDLERTIRALLG